MFHTLTRTDGRKSTTALCEWYQRGYPFALLGMHGLLRENDG